MHELTNLGNADDFVTYNGVRMMKSTAIARLMDKRHKNVMTDIRKLVESGVINGLNFQPVDYTDKKGEKRPMYLLDFDATMTLITGYDAKRRAVIIKRWRMLETGQAKPAFVSDDPTTMGLPDFRDPIAAAEAWIEQAKGRALAEARVKELEPKAAFYDDVAGSKDAIDIGIAAKVLNIPFNGGKVGRNQLFEILRALGILKSDNIPYQRFIDAGYFRVIEQKFTTQSGETRIYFKTLVYQRGLEYIRRKVIEYINAMDDWQEGLFS